MGHITTVAHVIVPSICTLLWMCNFVWYRMECPKAQDLKLYNYIHSSAENSFCQLFHFHCVHDDQVFVLPATLFTHRFSMTRRRNALSEQRQ